MDFSFLKRVGDYFTGRGPVRAIEESKGKRSQKPTYEKIPLRQTDTMIAGDRYLEEKVTDSALFYSVEPDEYPVCTHYSVSHSSGVAVSRMVARFFHDRISQLVSLHDTFTEELLMESTPDLEQLETHARLLLKLCDFLEETVNIKQISKHANLVLFRFPEGDDVLFKMSEVRDSMKRNYLAFSDLHDTLKKKEKKHRQKIDFLLKEKDKNKDKIIEELERIRDERVGWKTNVGEAMKKIQKDIKSLSNDISSIKERLEGYEDKIRNDWVLDIKQIWSDHNERCKPATTRACVGGG